MGGETTQEHERQEGRPMGTMLEAGDHAPSLCFHLCIKPLKVSFLGCPDPSMAFSVHCPLGGSYNTLSLLLLCSSSNPFVF